MRKLGWSAPLITAFVVIATVSATRATVGAVPSSGPATVTASSLVESGAAVDDTLHQSSLPGISQGTSSTSVDDVLAVAPVAVETEPPTPEPTVAPTVAPVAPTRAQVAPPAPVTTPAPTAAPMSCPATYFCYPRLGIAGPIVPYTDCSGSTDVGTSIRSYSCLSDFYLMGHAYTQFGLVRQWVAGDVVFAWGRRFTVYGALTEQSCAAPVFPLAPLSMQTSLSSATCGPVLVVQAR
jgi:hypothetical protein